MDVLTMISRFKHAGEKEVLPYQCRAPEPETDRQWLK